MYRKTFALLLIMFASAAWPGAMLVEKGLPKIYVVAIGISEYSDPYLKGLRTPEREATRILEALSTQSSGARRAAGTTLLLGKDATKHEILSAVTTTRAMLSEDDVLIIYFSGHATSSQKGEAEEIYLIPVDGSPQEVQLTGIGVGSELVPAGARPDADVVLIIDGCSIGDALYGRVSDMFPRVSVLSASKRDELAYEYREGSPFTNALLEGLQSADTDFDRDGLISLEETFISLYQKVVSQGFGNQHPSLSGSRVHRVMVARAPMRTQQLVFSEPLPEDVMNAQRIMVNGQSVQLDPRASTPSRLALLGDTAGLVGRGMTYIDGLKNQYLYWLEEQTLERFKDPYAKSYAVLVAIDDYDRIRDPKRRGKTGFEAHGMMVENAVKLKATLLGMGFPAEHIIELYDENATSEAIDKTLKSFWKGGKNAAADRVFFYFGGHGSTYDGSGTLITYDFDRSQPTQTGFLMRDLTTRHSENMVTRQVLFALDACASGLAVYRAQGDPPSVPNPTFQQLSVIRNDTEGKARNFLVAGVADQAAIWDRGGIFTQALLAGLNGKGDLNNDRLIQFLELATYVANDVTRRASEKNVKQQVMPYVLDSLGTGKMVFFNHPKLASVAR